MSGPPFRTVRGAVRWAYFTVWRPLLQESSIYRNSSDQDLTVTEKRAQAALMVMRAEEALDRDHMAYVRVMWLKPGNLSRTASARRRDMQMVADSKKAHWDLLLQKKENGTRLTKAESKILDAGSPVAERDELPLFFKDDASPEIWESLTDTIRERINVNSRGLGKLIRRCRGDPIGLHAVRKDLGCARSDVMTYEHLVRDALQSLDDAVVARLSQRFWDNLWVTADG